MEAVAAFLRSHGLGSYAAAFEELGYDDLELLPPTARHTVQELKDEELLGLRRDSRVELHVDLVPNPDKADTHA